MCESIIEKIASFTRSQSRNKIVFHRQEITGITSVNIGQLLSEALYNLGDAGKLPMRASMELDNILQSSVFLHEEYGKCLAIANPGILFEPEIKLDFSWLLDNYSQNNALFVHWEGEIDSDNIYFLTRKNGIKINIRNLSHIVI